MLLEKEKESEALAGGRSHRRSDILLSSDTFDYNKSCHNQDDELLVIHTKFVDKLRKWCDFTQSKWRLQAVARSLVGGRLNACYRAPRVKNGSATLHYSPSKQRAFWHGLITCGQVWLCPVCSTKIATRRLKEIKIALDSDSAQWMMLTVTIQHHRGDELSKLIEDLNESIKVLYQSRAWKEIKADYGLIGSISGFEIRFSKASGWHPHRHIIFAFDGSIDLGGRELALIRVKAQEVIFRHLDKLGYKTVAGVTVKESKQRTDAYITKIASELSLGHGKSSKQSYSPFQLLEAYRRGERWAGDAFREYADATKGKQFIRWTPKLKAFFNVKELTDKELAESKEADDAILIQSISTDSELWKAIKKHNLHAKILIMATVSEGNSDALEDYFRSLEQD